MQDNDGYHGTQRPEDAADEYNAFAFIVRQILSGRNYAALVKVVAVEAPNTVDVQPLVNQLDGQGNAVPHGVVNDLPYVRMQGGANAIILDPRAGDIGICVFCDRDSSAVQATRDAANPGSLRRSDMADGVYIGGVLNGAPTQYVSFTDDGLELVSPKRVTVTAPSVVIDADAAVRIDSPDVSTAGNLRVGGGATGTFSTPQGTVVTVKDGVITNIF